MINKLRTFESDCFDPHNNLALEKHLMDITKPGECLLYLWQNQNTVVIGRNQNAWLECRTSLLEEEGGTLARRLSGGGAVFHDLGNLNFTFIMCKEDYDLDKQLSVIQKACAYAGIEAAKSGRNDLLADGRKFFAGSFHKITNAHFAFCKIADDPQTCWMSQCLEYFCKRSQIFRCIICHKYNLSSFYNIL